MTVCGRGKLYGGHIDGVLMLVQAAGCTVHGDGGSRGTGTEGRVGCGQSKGSGIFCCWW